ncbi:single-stranded DNA-binding protein [Listeria phage LMTA-34]|uniref:Single-stranded DNA-binding protein n=1 Tax=Listeria phage LMTA-34 TaxID=1486397 RepID=A0A076G5X9_9CAUD|nr:single-stranded DNA-binding protein [Listeria phage LMTA-34]
MVNFKEFLKQENQENESNNNEEVAFPKGKHQRLFLSKKSNTVVVRILPPANLTDNYAQKYRKIMLNNVMTDTGKALNPSFTLPWEPNEDSPLEQALADWYNRGVVPNYYGGKSRPSKATVVNAVALVTDANGNWVHEVDEYGQLVVRVLDLPYSAYTGINRKLADPMLNTTGSDYSFISDVGANPIRITKPTSNTEKAYQVEVYTGITLPPLPENWRDQLEDLAYQVSPSEDYNSKFVNFVIERVNAVTSGGAQQQQANPYGGQQAPQQQGGYQQQVPQQQGGYQQQVPQQQAYQQPAQQTQAQTYQQPVQQQQQAQTYQQPTQAYQAPTQQVPQQQAYQAPAQPTQAQTYQQPVQQQQQAQTYQQPTQAYQAPTQQVPQQQAYQAPVQQPIQQAPVAQPQQAPVQQQQTYQAPVQPQAQQPITQGMVDSAMSGLASPKESVQQQKPVTPPPAPQAQQPVSNDSSLPDVDELLRSMQEG